MQTMTLIPGSPEWHAHRAQHFNASDAPAMLGCSPYGTRAQLLQRMHTGLSAEVDAATQRRFDDGHRFEALARPVAEKIIGDDLAPVVGVLEGTKLSASFDGLTLLGDTAFEHKTLNDDLRGCMRDQGNGYDLPKHYRVQMEQQLLVSGADRVLFMASKWAGDEIVESRHCWYACDPVLRAEIVAGWEQFAADLKDFVAGAAIQPAPVAAPIEALPAVSVRMDGALAVHSNLDVFGAKLREFIARIPAKPTDDQEFADCDAACKALKKAEDALDGAEASALGQVSSVETLTRTIADLRNVARTARLAAEKVVKVRKEQIRLEEVLRGQKALAEFITGLNETIGRSYMPAIPNDFAGAISGKKTLESLHAAVDQHLADKKIEASAIAGRIVINGRTLHELAGDYMGLFPDTAALVLKAEDDFRAVVTSRIGEHKATEQKRLDAERERIRQEEVARIERERQETEARATRQREAEEAQARQAAAPAPTPTPPAAAAPAPNVVPMRTTAAPAAPQPATLTLGGICERLGFNVTAAFLHNLGIDPTETDKAAKKFTEGQWDLLCMRLVSHIQHVAIQQRAA